MIESLHISNYALIDKIDIDFHSGFNIITGETGAGKSIILGALSLILGERADTKVVRDPNKKSIIEVIFSFDENVFLQKYCAENDLEWVDKQCILRREIAPNGRTRAFVNDSPVSLSQLQEIASQLIDIHSQHQNRLITSSEFQINIIDSLAHNDKLLTEYTTRYSTFRNAVKKLKGVKDYIDKNNSDKDFILFQLQQLESMNLIKGEQAELEKEREILSNLTEIKLRLKASLDALSSNNYNAISLLKVASDNCSQLNNYIDDAKNLFERLESARIEIQDIADTLDNYNNNLNADPLELESIELRLNNIYSLQHRHNVNSVEDLIDIKNELKLKLNTIENGDEYLAKLEKEAKQAQRYALEIAKGISESRKKEAKNFALLLKERAKPLGMKNLQCEVAVTNTSSLQPNGIDNIEFLFAFNKNQPLMSVRGSASGGEISRLMLSIKSIIADRMSLPSIIFDEIDTGVSGDIANKMGEMMRNISNNIQIIAITHLPQVAAKGDWQYKVYKEDNDISTTTHIRQLSQEERIKEIANMLSGTEVDEAAIANAKSLLNNI